MPDLQRPPFSNVAGTFVFSDWLNQLWAWLQSLLGRVASSETNITSLSSTVSTLSTTVAGMEAPPYLHTLWLPATAMVARTTSGPATSTTETTTNKVMIVGLAFDKATDEFAQFTIRMPKGWNYSTITAKFSWYSAVSGTNSVVWGIQALARSNDDAMDTAFGTAQTVTDAQTAQGDIMETAATSAITAAGTPASEDHLILQVYRDADNASDNLDGDAILVGVTIFYTVTTLDDA